MPIQKQIVANSVVQMIIALAFIKISLLYVELKKIHEVRSLFGVSEDSINNPNPNPGYSRCLHISFGFEGDTTQGNKLVDMVHISFVRKRYPSYTICNLDKAIIH
ncbi:uncharacterized protein [Spinacia oleracea]|uniref:Uncharacterized protein n=1 Tax=Spinacia oleracea TaxID=3562 RepID=A0ABM3QH10_SPIOL|nr:uncharacterized protein LOC130459352 [Spinacia oleracea]